MAHNVLVVEDNPAGCVPDPVCPVRTFDRCGDRGHFRRRAGRIKSAGFQDSSESWPDIVLLDINLPKIDGLELLQRLAAAPCPIVVMSSSQSPNRPPAASTTGQPVISGNRPTSTVSRGLGEWCGDLLAEGSGIIPKLVADGSMRPNVLPFSCILSIAVTAATAKS